MEATMQMDYFSNLMRIGPKLMCWRLEADGSLAETEEEALQIVYRLFTFNCGDMLQKHLQEAPEYPLALYDKLGLSWIAVPELEDGQVRAVYILGPTFTAGTSLESLRITMRSLRYPAALSAAFERVYGNIPVISFIFWMQYGQMLCYTVTGQELPISDFRTQTARPLQKKQSVVQMPTSTAWVYEQIAMEMIEQGQLHYQEAFGRLFTLQETAAPSQSESYVRMNKNAVISFITLSTRAAIRGGLDPETAYYVGNSYIESAEKISALPELARLNQMMYEDFIQRVHRIRENTGVSPEIMAACSYIERHIAEKISVDTLAENAGYSKVYFSQKFRKELGINVGTYIKQQRIGRAKLLLKSTNLSIQEIGAQLGFCNNSYFAETFKDVAGMSPGEFRESGIKVSDMP